MEEPDLDLDNHDRISRRIAHGVYRILHNGKEVGEELWGVFGLLNGGYRLMTEIDLKWPVPNQQRAHLDLDTNWQERKLFVQLDAQGRRRNAYYAVGESGAEVNVFEESLRYAEANGGRQNADQPFQAALGPKPKRMFGDTLPYTGSTFFDFGSTLMNFAHLKRLNLQLGKRAAMQAIVVTQPSLEPLQVSQTYVYLRDEVIATSLRPTWQARRYQIEESNTDGSTPITTIWVDAHDVAVKQDVSLGKDTHGCELISYAWQSE